MGEPEKKIAIKAIATKRSEVMSADARVVFMTSSLPFLPCVLRNEVQGPTHRFVIESPRLPLRKLSSHSFQQLVNDIGESRAGRYREKRSRRGSNSDDPLEDAVARFRDRHANAGGGRRLFVNFRHDGPGVIFSERRRRKALKLNCEIFHTSPPSVCTWAERPSAEMTILRNIFVRNLKSSSSRARKFGSSFSTQFENQIASRI